MVNYACAFSDSELGEKFEWIIIKVNYLFHMLPLMKTGWHSHRLQRKLGYLLNLDLCCLTREWLLFLSLKLTGERLGNRRKHFFLMRINNRQIKHQAVLAWQSGSLFIDRWWLISKPACNHKYNHKPLPKVTNYNDAIYNKNKNKKENKWVGGKGIKN